MNAFYLLLYVVVLSTLAKADFQDVNYKVSSPSPNTQYNVNGTIFINYELLPTKNTYGGYIAQGLLLLTLLAGGFVLKLLIFFRSVVNSIAIFFLQEANNYTITLNADLSQSTARNATDGNPSWQLSWSLPNSTVPGACTVSNYPKTFSIFFPFFSHRSL